MALFCPHHAPATRKSSPRNGVISAIHKIDAIHKTKDLRDHLDAIRLSVHRRRTSPWAHSAQVDATITIIEPAPSLLRASNADARAPASDFEKDASSGRVLCLAADQDASHTKAVDYERTSEHGELSQLLEDTYEYGDLSQLLDDNATTRLQDQFARVESLETCWSPWESELLQDDFWGSGSDVENDAAGI
ncbi:hypothetical protein T484DRAFT_1751861 [Baffinella frigidus]|jgi:hypothetical protein|nr:hypothetical protein T484DRAFT_1751861 [Cryptophyta sp. CCMP2293]